MLAKGAYLEGAQQTLVDTHHCTGVVKLSAIIGSTEQRDQLPLREELIAIFNHLMGSTYQIHVMLLQEARNYIRAKCERDTSVILAPTGDIFIWIRPQEVTEKTTIRDLSILARVPALPRENESRQAKDFARLTSVGRITRRICSIEFRSGLKPPCIVKIFSSMIAAIGKQLKQSVNVFHSLILYLRLHSS